VALSRARLGLYILGRTSVFESCFELKPAFDILLSRPTKLTLVTDELYAASHSRLTGSKVEEGSEAVMEGVEHLGQYVYEMTKAKVEALKNGAMGGDVSMAGTGPVAGAEEVDEHTEAAPSVQAASEGLGESITIDGPDPRLMKRRSLCPQSKLMEQMPRLNRMSSL
jgi:intron-binding protein aquarius